MNIDRSNQAVRDLLQDNQFHLRALTIETSPVGDGRTLTTIIRNANRDDTWHQNHTNRLGVTLRSLPGHPHIRTSAIRDFITIIWDGV